ncbi:MAG: tRNA1(Val) (adenine(37)-N6)-methyltransferase [Treponema sp.]|nr:tRNA1(Val) (adenine(37)-N6)-methyltransferase [Candidatus Treponema equi]
MANNLSIDELSQCGSPYRIYQDKSKFCFGIDAILLADYAKNARGNKVCDLCTGNGIVPILLADKIKAQTIHGLELQHDIANMARESIKLNDLENRIQIFEGDLKEACTILEKNTYDIVTVNPPYMKTNAQTKENSKSIARQEIYCKLEDVIKAAGDLLKSNGKLFMVHRPNRLGEIFILFEKYNLGARRMKLVQPKENEKPTMVLVEAEKCAHPELLVESVLTIYSQPGVYTKEVNEIYGRSV